MRHLLIAASVAVAPGPEALGILTRYLAIDTQNPPGHEAAAAAFLAAELAKAGVEAQAFAIDAGRADLVARWPGTGKKRPVVLLHHMDVAPATVEGWRFPPIGGTEADGWLYGRGAADLKGKGAVDLVAFTRLARSGRKLDRDVIFLAVADGEGASLGTRWLLANRPGDLGRAEFLIDEGAAIRPGKPPAYLVAIGQKTPVRLTLTFSGDGAPVRAAAAVQRIAQAAPAPRLIPALVPFVSLQLGGQDPRAPGVLAAAVARWPEVAAAVTDTYQVTRIQAEGTAATVAVDVRLLPGSRVKDAVARVRQLVRDPGYAITTAGGGGLDAAPMADAQGPFMRALARVAARHDPGATVVPVLAPATTDAPHYRLLGIQAVGFEPYALPDADYARAHGVDERIPVAELGRAVERLTDLLTEL